MIYSSTADTFVDFPGVAERIHDYYVNTHSYFLNQLGASLKEPVDWLERQDTWARRQVHNLQEQS